MSGIGDIRERRRQRILGNSEERMKKLMGLNEQFVAEHPKVETKEETSDKVEEKLDTDGKVTEKLDINHNSKGQLDQIEKVKEKKVRKISFGNLISNSKKNEALEKVRKISLNLEKISSIDEECLEKDLAKKSITREFEKELKFDPDILNILRRPQLNNVRQTEIIKEKKVSRSDANIDDVPLNQVSNTEKVLDNSENQLLNENYEAKRRSLEKFAKQIRQDDKEFKKIFSLSSKHTKEEPEEDNESGQEPVEHRTSTLVMLLCAILTRLFISLLPLYLQNIMLVFGTIEICLASYQYLFFEKIAQDNSINMVEFNILRILGVKKEFYFTYKRWLNIVKSVLSDLCVFLFTFMILHSFLHDPLACDFNTR